jgi:hypothetical protein
MKNRVKIVGAQSITTGSFSAVKHFHARYGAWREDLASKNTADIIKHSFDLNCGLFSGPSLQLSAR